MTPDDPADPVVGGIISTNRPAPTTVSTRIVGYIDAIEGRRISGWAWNKADPDRVLDVEIRLDGSPLLMGRADRFRKDLEREGIGDGRHAFEITLDPPAPPEKHRISAFARSGKDGAFTQLINRAVETQKTTSAPRDPSTTIPVLHLRRWLDELQASQRAVEAALKTASNEFREALQTGSATSAAEMKEIKAAIEGLRATQQQLIQQMAALEVFQTRFDAALGAFEQAKAKAQSGDTKEDRGLRLTVAALIILSTASLALGLWTVLG